MVTQQATRCPFPVANGITYSRDETEIKRISNIFIALRMLHAVFLMTELRIDKPHDDNELYMITVLNTTDFHVTNFIFKSLLHRTTKFSAAGFRREHKVSFVITELTRSTFT